MKPVKIYTTVRCPYCVNAKALLNKLNVPFEEIPVDQDQALRLQMEKLSGRRTVPQIFIDEQPIGGFDDLSALQASGRLEELLKD